MQQYESKRRKSYASRKRRARGGLKRTDRLLLLHRDDKRLAEHIEAKTGGTLYSIVPEEPYTEDDLKYYTDCRADREQSDPDARPEIEGSVSDMGAFDVIFLGYPIWHSQAPKIIYTFLESYDFSGKTIIPFCTSASSPIGSSATNLHPLTEGATWQNGTRFPSDASENAVSAWLDGLGY